MAIKDYLMELEKVNGYLATGVFTPQGELLEGSADLSGIHFETAGSQIHDTLLAAQTMTKDAGFGKTNMIQIDTELGIVFAKCYNDGNIHFHTILVIRNDGNVAMSKLKLRKAVEGILKEF